MLASPAVNALWILCLGAGLVRLYCHFAIGPWRKRALAAESLVPVLQKDAEVLAGLVKAQADELATVKELYLAAIERNTQTMNRLLESERARKALVETLRLRDKALAGAKT